MDLAERGSMTFYAVWAESLLAPDQGKMLRRCKG